MFNFFLSIFLTSFRVLGLLPKINFSYFIINYLLIAVGFYLLPGGTEDIPGFVGCMRLISIDGNYKLPTDWKPEVLIYIFFNSYIHISE